MISCTIPRNDDTMKARPFPGETTTAMAATAATGISSSNLSNPISNDSCEAGEGHNNENTLVAESDFQAALLGIETKMSELQESGTTAATIMSDEDRELLDQAEASLKESLARVMQRVEDENFYQRFGHYPDHDLVEEFEVQYEEPAVAAAAADDEEQHEAFSEEQPDSNDTTAAKNVVVNIVGVSPEHFFVEDDDDDDAAREDVESEIDEDDLVDNEAVERAQQLRDQVRNASMSLTKYKDSITKKADEVWMKEDYSAAEMQTKMMPFVNIADMKYAFRGKTRDATLKSLQVLEMVANLQKLTKDLTRMDLETPTAQLVETVQTVEKGMAAAEPEAMSQTEQAIKSRTNEGGDSIREAAENAFNDESAPPADRLAAFLALHAE